MGQKAFSWITLLLLTAAMSGSAFADVKGLGTYQSWNVFGGTAEDGNGVCGMATAFTGNRSFYVKIFSEIPGIEVMISKTGWSIPAGVKTTAILKFGSNSAWAATLYGSGDFLYFTTGPDQVKTFVHEFTSSDSLSITFLEGNELPWIGTLNGTSAAFNKMGDCVAALKPPVVTQPFTSQNTQPFAPDLVPPSQDAPDPDAKMVRSPAKPQLRI